MAQTVKLSDELVEDARRIAAIAKQSVHLIFCTFTNVYHSYRFI